MSRKVPFTIVGKMVSRSLLVVLLVAVILYWSFPDWFLPFSKGRMHIMLDPGHTVNEPGALGVRGKFEKEYNDQFVEILKQLLLEDSRYHVSVSRIPQEELSLVERVQRVKAEKPNLLLSIHHDSVGSGGLKTLIVDGLPAAMSILPKQGYSMYLSQKNPHLNDALSFALEIGRSMEAIGRNPFKFEKGYKFIAERRLMNKRFGILQYDNLGILRRSDVPAVLFELGFVVDVEDEQYIEEHRELLAKQVKNAIDRYRKEVWLKSGES